MGSTPEQQHQHDQTVDRELYDEILEDRGRLRDQATAVKAVVNAGQPDYLAAIYEATGKLYRLLELPQQRPGAWEAPHVEALGEQLGEVLDALKAERPAWLAHDGGAA